jgi:hypothetical protein
MAAIEVLESPDPEQLATPASSKEGDVGLEEVVKVEGEGVLGGRRPPREGQVSLEERAHVS